VVGSFYGAEIVYEESVAAIDARQLDSYNFKLIYICLLFTAPKNNLFALVGYDKRDTVYQK